MGTKTISIMDDAYDILKSKKYKDESFSDVIRRITSDKRRDIMRFAGIWKNVDERDIENMKKNIMALRRKSTDELLKNLNRK